MATVAVVADPYYLESTDTNGQDNLLTSLLSNLVDQLCRRHWDMPMVSVSSA